MNKLLRGERITPEQKAEKRKFLDERDRELVSRGLKKLVQILGDKSDNDLPKVFIFPDTGARVLLQAIKPVVNKIYDSRGLPKPDYQFFAIHKDANIIQASNNEEAVLKSMQKYLQDQIDGYREINSNGKNTKIIEALEKQLKEMPEKIKNIARTIDVNMERMQEIKDNARLKSNDTIMFVDDYISGGDTSMMIDYLLNASGYEEGGIKDERFAFYKCHFTSSPHLQWDYGTSDHDGGFQVYSGFSYRSPDVHRATGVKKELGEKYSVPSEQSTAEERRALRQEFKEIGEEYLERMK